MDASLICLSLISSLQMLHLVGQLVHLLAQILTKRRDKIGKALQKHASGLQCAK